MEGGATEVVGGVDVNPSSSDVIDAELSVDGGETKCSRPVATSACRCWVTALEQGTLLPA